MTVKAAFFKGVRLHENCQAFPIPNMAPEAGRQAGVTQLMGTLISKSPNFILDLSVLCSVPAPSSPYSDLDDQMTHNMQLHQEADALIAVAKDLGDLCWCQDDTQKANVTGGPYGPGAAVVSHDSPGGSWSPTTARYVLFRDPSTSAGFVTLITGTGAGTISAALDVQVTSAWDVYNVQLNYPSVRYLRMNTAPPDIPSGDRHKTGAAVEYVFEGMARHEMAASHVQSLG